MARSNRWKNGFFLHFMFEGWLYSYWPSYLHYQHAPFDGYNPPQLPALSHSHVHCHNCFLWVDRECLSGGTRPSCPSTPQLSSRPWSLLECHYVAICVSGFEVLGHALSMQPHCPTTGNFFWAKSSNRSGEEKKLSTYSLWPKLSIFLPLKHFRLSPHAGEKVLRQNCLRTGGSSDSYPQPVK